MKLATTALLVLTFLSAHAQAPDSLRGAKKYDDGMLQYRAGNYQNAINLFTEATEIFGDEYVAGHAKALQWIGYAYLRLSENDKMIDYFKQAEHYAREVLKRHNDYKPIISNQLMLSMMLKDLNDGKEALIYYDNLEALIQESEPNPMYMSIIYQHRAQIAQRNRELELVPGYLEKSIAFANESGNRRQLIEVIETSQLYFYELGNFDKAVQLSDEVIRLATLEYGPKGSDLARYFTERARLDFVRQEHEMAMNWVDRGLELGTNQTSQYFNDFGYSYYIKGNLLLNQQAYQKAIEYFDLALKEYEDQLLHLNLIVATLDGKLRCMAYLKDSAGINSTIEEIMHQLSRRNVKKLVKANALLAVGFGYSALNDFDNATKNLDQVIAMVDENDKGTSVPLYAALYQYSKMELARGDTKQALDYINEAIVANRREVDGETYFISNQSIAELLIHKATVLQSTDQKEEALAVLIDGFERVQTDRALLVGTEYSMEAIQQLRNPALDLCYQLYQESGDDAYIEKAFRFGELAKSQQLIQWTTESINSKTGAIDSTLFEQRRTLINTIGTLERLIINEDSTSIASQYSDSLFSLKRQLYDVSLLIKDNHPTFYEITYEKMNAELGSTVSSLEPDEQLLAYFVTDDNAYLLVIGDVVDFIKVDQQDIDNEVENFRSALMDPSQDNFLDYGQKLHARLFPSEALKLKQKLTIVTDGILAYIPFELLINNSGQFLLESHDISYAYSAHSMNNPMARSSNQDFVAFAPDFKYFESSATTDLVRGELARLPGALQEAKTVTEIHSGIAFTDSAATESNFRKHATQVGLIHLATHAIVDDAMPNQSRLAFNLSSDSTNDGYLHVYEIFNLDLNAQLVTLSACNTGFGKIRKGEGVMSLSRAFAYAGVPSTVVSLWPASDKSTPELMTYFYQNLKDGQTKDVALNNARKQYLANAQGKARHPFYWGGFVLIGDTEEIGTDRNLLVYLIPSVLIIVMILTLYRRKRSLKQQ